MVIVIVNKERRLSVKDVKFDTCQFFLFDRDLDLSNLPLLGRRNDHVQKKKHNARLV